MKINRIFLFFLLAAIPLFTAACGAAPASTWPGLATDGKLAYLASAQYVYKISVSDGVEVTTPTVDGPVPARFPLKAESTKSFYATPVISPDGQLFIGSAATSDASFYSVDLKTNTVKWTFKDGKNPWVAGAFVSGDTVYAAAGDGILYALGLADGQVRWQFKASDHSLWSTPVSDGKLIFIVTLDHEVYALDPKGNKVWSSALDNAIMAPPYIAGDTIIVGTLSGKLFALNAASGNQKWVSSLDGSIWGSPASDGENVYIGTVKDKAGKFYAVNLQTGQITWSKDDPGAITASPLVTPTQIIYVTEAGKIQSIDKSGSPKWQAVIENAKLYTPPVLANDLILVAPMNATFLLGAYDLNGAQKWTFTGK